MSQFFPLTIAAVRTEAGSAAVLDLAVPEAMKPRFAHKQGQHLTLRAWIDGREVCRSYSLCNAVGAPLLRIAVKRVEGGVFSNWAAGNLRVGQQIDAMPPAGRFYVSTDESQSRHYAGFASGSGITPILSLMATALEQEPSSRFTLVYANRDVASMMFRESLADLKDRYPQRVSLIYLFSREEQEVDLCNGRLDQARCDALLKRWLPAASIDYAFVCGQEEMMNGVRRALEAAGVPAERIRHEHFGPVSASPARAPLVASSVAKTITLKVDGVTRRIGWREGTESILDEALAAGIDLRYSCKGGVCGTCRCKVIDGEVVMDEQYALDDDELRDGYVLSCRSRPASTALLLEFE